MRGRQRLVDLVKRVVVRKACYHIMLRHQDTASFNGLRRKGMGTAGMILSFLVSFKGGKVLLHKPPWTRCECDGRYHPNDDSHYPVGSEPNGLISLQSNGRLPQGLQGLGRSCPKRERGDAKSCWSRKLTALANQTHLNSSERTYLNIAARTSSLTACKMENALTQSQLLAGQHFTRRQPTLILLRSQLW